jgi:hypothetical protein
MERPEVTRPALSPALTVIVTHRLFCVNLSFGNDPHGAKVTCSAPVADLTTIARPALAFSQLPFRLYDFISFQNVAIKFQSMKNICTISECCLSTPADLTPIT